MNKSDTKIVVAILAFAIAVTAAAIHFKPDSTLQPKAITNVHCNGPLGYGANLLGVTDVYMNAGALHATLPDGSEAVYMLAPATICLITKKELQLNGPARIPERDQQALSIPPFQPEAS